MGIYEWEYKFEAWSFPLERLRGHDHRQKGPQLHLGPFLPVANTLGSYPAVKTERRNYNHFVIHVYRPI